MKNLTKEENGETDTKLSRLIVLFVVVYATVVIIGMLVEVRKRGFDGALLINAAVGVATIIMVGFVAFQAKATEDMVEQTKRQIELTRKSIEEIKKERMNVEFMKNEILAYIYSLRRILESNIEQQTLGDPGMSLPEYLSDPEYDYPLFLSNPKANFQELGVKLRIKRKIERLLEEYDINLGEYNILIEKVHRINEELIQKLLSDTSFVNQIQEVLTIFTEKQELPKIKNLITDLVLQSREDINDIPFPKYGGYSFSAKTETAYKLQLWDKVKEIFIEYLKNKPHLHTMLLQRNEDFKRLERMTVGLLERVKKMEAELLGNEKALEEKIMGL